MCSDSFARLDSVDFQYVKKHSRVARRGRVARPSLVAPVEVYITVAGSLPARSQLSDGMVEPGALPSPLFSLSLLYRPVSLCCEGK